jgi:hypothetical protein
MDTHALIAPVSNQRGITYIYIALTLALLLGFVGLAVDMGHLYLVRGELQNAADACALAGASTLYRQEPGAQPILDWEAARTTATDFITENESDKVALSGVTIEVGYWNLSSKIMEPTTITPTVGLHVPAVAATVSRATGVNGGEVPSFFAQILNILDRQFNSFPVSSRTAIATSDGVGATPPGGGIFPVALSQCLAENYFAQSPLPDPPPSIRINSVYTFPNGVACDTMQFTSLTTGERSAEALRTILWEGSQGSLSVGDQILIQPGAEASIFKEIDDWLAIPQNGDVLMPIVGELVKDINGNTWKNITGFAGFHIDRVGQNGSDKWVEGHFTEYYRAVPGTTPGGPALNTVTPPKLVQ